jgi:mycofactocin precursor
MTSTVTESVVASTTETTGPTITPDGAQPPYDDQVLAELLVEEISIDGMCGVY